MLSMFVQMYKMSDKIMDEIIIDIKDLKTYYLTDDGAVKAVDKINLKIEKRI